MAAKEYFSLQKQEPKRGCCERGSGFCACVLFLLIALVIAALVTAFVFLIMWVADHKNVVDTACGKVEGTFCPHSDAYIFRGIPYAAPPVEDLRWQAAVGLKKGEEDGAGPAGGECWVGVLEATEKKDTCVRIDRNSENNTVIGSEDCLYLNVFTPSIAEKHRQNTNSKPVMVFIHGERGADDKYQPGAKMASDMGIVVVTLQYRLGAMGFLVLGDDDGNYGLTDQIEALKWVKDNIVNFGGNPDNVTLIGQGSGSTCVLTLVASPEAKGLFHRAWAMSGAGLPSTPKGDSALEKDNSFVLTETECADIECLRNVTAEEVTRIVETKWSEEDLTNLPSPHRLPYARIIVDGKILTEKLSDALGDVTGSDIPLIIGSAAQSVDADPALGLAIKSMTTAAYIEYLNTHITENAEDEVLPMYNFSSSRDPEYKLTTLIADARYACSHDKMASKAVVAFSSPVIRYRIDHAPSSEVNAFGAEFPAKYAFMGWDLYAFLGKVGEDMAVAPTEADTKFQEKIQLITKNFILNTNDLTKYDGVAKLVSDRFVIEDKAMRDQICDFWNDNYFQYRAMF